MEMKTYTTADGATLKAGDAFYALARFSNAIRAVRVGTGRVPYADGIPIVGSSSWADQSHAFSTWEYARDARIDVLREEIDRAEGQIKSAKRQIKRNEKAILALQSMAAPDANND